MQLASPKPAQNQPKTSPNLGPKLGPKLAQNLHKSQIMLNNNYKKSSPCDLYEMIGSISQVKDGFKV
jgi:hypothetical protein